MSKKFEIMKLSLLIHIFICFCFSFLILRKNGKNVLNCFTNDGISHTASAQWTGNI